MIKSDCIAQPEKRMTEPEKKSGHLEIKLNDNVIRLIGIPLLGIIIPHAAGILDGAGIQRPLCWFNGLFFIILSALIWQGNRYLLFRTRKRFTWFDRPVEKLVLLVVNNVFYTAPLTIAWLCVWYQWAGYPKPDWNTIQIVTLINIMCVLFITHIYETVFMLKEQQGEQIRNSELLRAKAEAELEALRNQIDPHFMFNSLNSLSWLITSNPKAALEFTEHLADIYRYILSQKERSLIPLEDELIFMDKYTCLLELRFGSALNVKKHFSVNTEKQYLIPPISAFVAMENAVKHNELSMRNPLTVVLEINDDSLIITNNKREKKTHEPSSKIGLKNLDERFRIITGKTILTENSAASFMVSLPMIRMSR